MGFWIRTRLVGRKDLPQVHHFSGRSGVGKGLGILHELRELRKKGNGWPLHDPNTMVGYVISQTPTTIAKCEALSGPNYPLRVIKWRD